MSLTPEELSLHRQLLAAFDEYIKINLKWEEKNFVADARRTRKALRKVMNISYLRWQEIVVTLHKMYDIPDNEELKEAGIEVIKALNVAKHKNIKSNLKEENNSST